ncbi:MAG: hypothetical protein SVO01_00610 [Thermotogota bacterium]|nr:hypothetical protein [Thermotogota bacterium]
MKPFKIKFNGIKLVVRRMAEFEKIDENTLYTNDTKISKNSKWIKSNCPGDFVINHPNRIYVYVLSKFWSFP